MYSVYKTLLNLAVSRSHAFSTFAIRGNCPLVYVEENENRRGRTRTRISSKEGTAEDEEIENTLSSSDSSRQRDVFALFRRIRASIAEAESNDMNRDDSVAEDRPSETLRKILGQSKKEEKGKITNTLAGKGLKRSNSFPRKDKKTQNNQAAKDYKLIRAPSNFADKSPIPSPSSPRGNTVYSKDDEASLPPATVEKTKSPSIEKMKLPELKGLAKARGIKGYSKMKKSELVNLLRL